mmetsp:Transcript_19167/g.34685  ORF Transcript_19167/g.34685 Transcript_19167/m.34685 type:complete len:172 (-) Transcript_19167:562-1077(-)
MDQSSIKLPPVIGRDVDKLDALPDEKLKRLDREYFERKDIRGLLDGLLESLIVQQPLDPVQFIIDYLQYSPDYAKQDPETGLPEHRKNKLLDVFLAIDKARTGKVSLDNLRSYANKYGGLSLTVHELSSMFQDFKPHGDNFITRSEFITFFSRVSRTINNENFNKMINELA